MFRLRIYSLLVILVMIPGRMVSQNTLFDILYCLNGGENKSVGISRLPTPNPPVKPGWNLIFSDEFQPGGLNPAHWNRSRPGDDGGGNCARNFAVNPANIAVDSGSARISNTIDAAVPGCAYSCGEIKTMSVLDTAFGSFYFYAPGYLETRVKLFSKTAQGASCWLWAVGTPENPGLPGPWNEIDIFELNGVNQNIFTGTYHWTFDTLHVSQNHAIFLTDSSQLYDLTTNWTTFGLEWDTTSVKWFVNNTLVKELDMNVIPPFCIHAPHYSLPVAPFCIRFGTGYNSIGNQGSVANPADFPQSMLVDYVRVYKKTGQKAAPIIMQDGQYQICATASSQANSDKVIRSRYYPDVTYEWSSPAFDMVKMKSGTLQPPEKMLIWIKPGITAGNAWPVYLKAGFPGNYTEYDTAYIYIAPDVPAIPPDNFTALQLDSSCYFSIATTLQPGIAAGSYSNDNGSTWLPGRHQPGAGNCSFGSFKPGQTVNFAFRTENGCGISPVRYSTLTMPAPPHGCKWPAGTGDLPQGASGQNKPLVLLSPNPAKDVLNISFSSASETVPGNLVVKVYDIHARELAEIALAGRDTQLDVVSLHPGVYCLRVVSGEKILFHSLFLKN
ncbi:MAG: T9SS type A sorting domain-containing protein [Bacteroidota bacterium]